LGVRVSVAPAMVIAEFVHGVLSALKADLAL
jgi:hypothetical protein